MLFQLGHLWRCYHWVFSSNGDGSLSRSCSHYLCITTWSHICAYSLGPSHSLAAVDDDILWLDPLLQHALFRMLAPTPEQPRRLNLKVANTLFVVVQQTVAIFIHNLLVGFFQNLQQKSNNLNFIISSFEPKWSKLNLRREQEESNDIADEEKKRRRRYVTSFSSLVIFFLASTLALCMAWISPKSHLSRSLISDLSSLVIS